MSPRRLPTGDRVPSMPPVNRARLPAPVRARLDLERVAGDCDEGARKAGRLQITAGTRQALISILAGSPAAGSPDLRPLAASMAEKLRLDGSRPHLRRMALDRTLGPGTRAAAVHAWVSLATNRSRADVDRLLDDRHPLIRATAYVAALEHDDDALRRHARRRYGQVRQMVVRRIVGAWA